MPSPHGAFCASPHAAFIESPHSVRGCEPSGYPMYFAVSWTGLRYEWELVDLGGGTFPFAKQVVDYDTRTRVYRIDNGRVTWAATRPDESPSHDGTDDSIPSPLFGQVHWFDVNACGVYLLRVRRVDYDASVHVGDDVNSNPVTMGMHLGTYRVERIDPDTGEVIAWREAQPGFDDFVANYPPFYMCANLQHVFLFSGLNVSLISHLHDNFAWAKLDASLNLVDSGVYTGPWADAASPDHTTISATAGGFGRPVITPTGDPRHLNLVLDRDDPGTVLEHRTGVVAGFSHFIHGSGVIAIDAGSHVISGGASGATPRVIVDNTGVYHGVTRAVRGPSPLGSELLGFLTATGDILYGRSTAAQPGDGAPAYPYPATWSIDVLALLRDHVATLDRPAIPEGASLKLYNVCHDGSTEQRIRVVGTLRVNDAETGVMESVDFFAAQITRGFGASGTASVDWYVDSAFTPDGGVAIERPEVPPPSDPGPPPYEYSLGPDVQVDSIAVATGVMGSGIDYVFSPAN